MRSFKLKINLVPIYTIIALFSVFLGIYKWGIPALISNQIIADFAGNQIGKFLNADVKIVKPVLKTGINISFTVEEVSINVNRKNILKLSNIDTLISLRNILKREIEIKKFLSDNIYADIDDLSAIIPKKEKKKKEKKEGFIKVNVYNILLGGKHLNLVYNCPNYDIDFKANHFIFDRTGERKYLHFDFDLFMKKGEHKVSFAANDMNRFYMENRVAYIKDFPIEIDNSKILINAHITHDGKYELNISAEKFNANDVYNIVTSNIFVANGSQMLAPIGDVNGTVNFNLKLTKNLTKGHIKVNEVNFKVLPLLNMPVKITNGSVNIGNKNIEFKDFEGYYNNKSENSINFKGDTKDYHNSCDTTILSKIFVTNDFFKNYITKMIGSPVELVGNADSFFKITSKNGTCDILWYFILKEGEGFKFGEQSMVLKEYKTLFKVDLSILSNILKINTLNYYIANELKRGMTPVLEFNGNIDMSDNMKYLDFNLNIPRPLPSEFLNFLAGQKIFKRGQVSGKMSIDNHGKFPFMNGEFSMDKVFVPSQRIYIRSGKFIADGSNVKVKSNGKFRRSDFVLDGTAINEIKLPIIVKDVNLVVDNIDVERILTAPPNPQTPESDAAKALVSTGKENEENDDNYVFTKGLIVVEKCLLNLKKGVYKDINFSNIKADMTLDNEGILNLKSNRFDIAEGFSTLKVKADLVNREYYLKLGVKNVDSNIMATSILGLPRQITGKAKGLIELTADKSLKLNGNIKFMIENGTIEQVGYVQYILKVASLFRNPLAMVSPSTLYDLVTVPNGEFDSINGEMKLKDNIIERMKIQSTAPELATLIFGRYNLTTNDASLRIYTKFSDKGTGLAGILRNISLNSLAHKISISSRNESNYYSSELEMIPKLQQGEEKAQVFITKIDGDVINYNFLSSLKRIK